jgi:hypothetical protein
MLGIHLALCSRELARRRMFDLLLPCFVLSACIGVGSMAFSVACVLDGKVVDIRRVVYQVGNFAHIQRTRTQSN